MFVQVWNHLVIKAANKPVEGNQDGSYLTFFSSKGLTFGIINIIGNFGTVFCDQAYWVRPSLLLLCGPPSSFSLGQLAALHSSSPPLSQTLVKPYSFCVLAKPLLPFPGTDPCLEDVSLCCRCL